MFEKLHRKLQIDFLLIETVRGSDRKFKNYVNHEIDTFWFTDSYKPYWPGRALHIPNKVKSCPRFSSPNPGDGTSFPVHTMIIDSNAWANPHTGLFTYHDGTIQTLFDCRVRELVIVVAKRIRVAKARFLDIDAAFSAPEYHQVRSVDKVILGVGTIKDNIDVTYGCGSVAAEILRNGIVAAMHRIKKDRVGERQRQLGEYFPLKPMISRGALRTDLLFFTSLFSNT